MSGSAHLSSVDERCTAGSAADGPVVGGTSRSSARAKVLAVASPDRARLALSAGMATATALCTVGLLATSGALIDKSALRPPLYTLTLLMAAVQLLALARGPLRYGERLASHDAALQAVGRIRLWVYDVLAPRAPGVLAAWRSGDLLQRATADVDLLQDVYLRGVGPLITALITSTVTVAAAWCILPLGALVLGLSLVVGAGAASGLAWLRSRGEGPHGDRQAGSEGALRGQLGAEVTELLLAAPELVAMGRMDEYMARVVATDEALRARHRRRAWWDGAAGAVVVLATGAGVVSTLWVSAVAVSAHRLSAVMIAVLPLAALGVFEVVLPVADAVGLRADHLEAARRLVAVAETPIPVVDPPSAAPLPEASTVTFDRATLRYAADARPALDRFDLHLPEGRRIGVVGSSGAGKSSMVAALLRFWSLESGELALGGTDVTGLFQSDVRARFGWVAQDAHLFPTSIRSNIALARPTASDLEISDALKAAQLGPWVDTLDHGWHTEVGESGAQVSGGQRQRIALARALLADPPVLVLDEPTAGLDQATARRLLADVLAIRGTKTVIMITHRLDELVHMDEVAVVEAGRVVEYRTTTPCTPMASTWSTR